MTTPIREQNSLVTPASWIIREKATGKVLFETFNAAASRVLDASRYEVIPIGTYLAELNQKPT